MSEIRLLFLCIIVAIICAIISLNVSQANAGTYTHAKRYIGLHEVKHNTKLRRALGINTRQIPWCGAFVKHVHERVGKAVPKIALRSVSWLTQGRSVSLKNARKGDVVVLRTKFGHHVGFYAGLAGNGRVKILGGNQSNRVKYSNFRISSIRGIRRY